MSRFIQLHMLTSYPPANLNRDDLGRPKTAIMGGAQRLRISSQCLKRTWRTSPVVEEALKGNLGQRTRRMGRVLLGNLLEKGIDKEKAVACTSALVEFFGTIEKPKKGDDKPKEEKLLDIKELFFFSPEEKKAMEEMALRYLEEGKLPTEKDSKEIMGQTQTAVDLALFGRMVAKQPAYNVEAAAQVAHALSVHEVAVEEDFFSAVDELNEGEEDMGAGHIGETEFAAGYFYLYACINYDLLVKNLGGDRELADKGIRAFVEAMATSAPKGKINSFGSYAYTSYCLAEKGSRQPRSLSVSFLNPVKSKNMLTEAISALENTRDDMDAAYGPCAEDSYVMNVPERKGTLPELLDFIAG
ncbi:type I-E CRISPR-associated protein Cas7/Cse4/CasC [Dethiosulfatarculus sandiegensis]|uniref:CRISPR-associated protein Cse4 n=1 Tax=Dethiosulfatarculus sandiegensis TaxID=1429043 RepID=A0A0D2G785_9BACT|nr:type I-E CRISPR-associated protein Cas7/Cse4/CasC [Dethiosulfatarculus sandiegensis]KIX10837.1 CRISPR-associated protein Cse4 [Dethiosulfatarculus sandiegensis]